MRISSTGSTGGTELIPLQNPEEHRKQPWCLYRTHYVHLQTYLSDIYDVNQSKAVPLILILWSRLVIIFWVTTKISSATPVISSWIQPYTDILKDFPACLQVLI